MSWCNKKVLITGGLGFIGHNMAIHAIKNGASHISIYDNLSRNLDFNLLNKQKIQKIADDYNVYFDLDTKDLSEISTSFLSKKMSEFDIVIHLAAKVGGIGFYLDNSFYVMNNNIKIDRNVIESFVRSKSNTFIYASSSHVYSKRSMTIWRPSPVPEFVDNGFPELSYGAAKLFGEKFIMASKKMLIDRGKKAIIPRLVGIYGTGMDIDIEMASLIPALIHKSLNGKLVVNSPGNEVRTYLHINDTISAIEHLLNLQHEGVIVGPVNVCDDAPYKVSDIANIVSDITYNCNISYNFDNKPFIEWQVCSNKLLRDFGWRKTIDFRDGIKEVYEDILKRRQNDSSRI